MAAASAFSFAAINAADFAGFGVAIAAQLNLWAEQHREERRDEWQELIEAVAGLRQNAVDQSIVYQELVNRVTLVEINGNRVVDGMANCDPERREYDALHRGPGYKARRNSRPGLTGTEQIS